MTRRSPGGNATKPSASLKVDPKKRKDLATLGGLPLQAIQGMVGYFHTHQISLHPERWNNFTTWSSGLTGYQPQWQTFAFSNSQIQNIPNSPGVYAFLLLPPVIVGHQPCYIMYVGETTRTLRTRFKEYLREVNDEQGRRIITPMLRLYETSLTFACLALVGAPTTPKNCEDELLKALMPPWNTALPAEVRQLRPAF